MTAAVNKVLRQMRAEPAAVRFADLQRVCEHFFGRPRQNGSSHAIYKTPWPGDPRVNIQNDRGMAKAYQVRQVLRAIERLSAES
ncbi:MAG: toxin HicA [Betaproteobacteria bacterium]|nr:toxin HicA [Betaproteobacteria bacterium]